MKNEFITKNIKYLFEKKGISKTKFAKALGVDPKQVQRWLNDGAEPRPHTLIEIADFFNVPVDWLLTRDLNVNAGGWEQLERTINAINEKNKLDSAFMGYLKALGFKVELNYSIIDGTNLSHQYPDSVTLSYNDDGQMIKNTINYHKFEVMRNKEHKRFINNILIEMEDC